MAAAVSHGDCAHASAAGLTAACGAALLTALAVLAETLTREHAREAQQHGRAATDFAQILTRNAELVVGMGMTAEALGTWRVHHEGLLVAQEWLGRRATRLGSLARMSRQALQIAMLALGAWLVIDAQSSPGIMIAATILLGRALQPVEQLISAWKALTDARAAWSRLSGRTLADPGSDTALPAPHGRLDLDTLDIQGRSGSAEMTCSLAAADTTCSSNFKDPVNSPNYSEKL